MNGEILTLNKTINRFHQGDIERLNNIAKELITVVTYYLGGTDEIL